MSDKKQLELDLEIEEPPPPPPAEGVTACNLLGSCDIDDSWSETSFDDYPYDLELDFGLDKDPRRL